MLLCLLLVLWLVPFSVLCLVLEMVMLMLSVTMLRKADRLGFFQVVQCWSCLYPGYAIHVWLVYYYRDAYICILCCGGFVIVWARWLSFLAQLRLVREQLQLVGK